MLQHRAARATAFRSGHREACPDRMCRASRPERPRGLLIVQPAASGSPPPPAKIAPSRAAHHFTIEHTRWRLPGPSSPPRLTDDRGSETPATDDQRSCFALDLGDNRVPAAQMRRSCSSPAPGPRGPPCHYLLLVRRSGRADRPSARIQRGRHRDRRLRSLAVSPLASIGAEIVLLLRLTLHLGQPAFALSLGLGRAF